MWLNSMDLRSCPRARQCGLSLNSVSDQELYPYDVSNKYFTTADGIPIRKLYVSNISSYVDNETLLNFFRRYGVVEEAFIVKRSLTYGSNYGFVTFISPQVAAVILCRKDLFLLRKKLVIYPADSWHQPPVVKEEPPASRSVESGDNESEFLEEEIEMEDQEKTPISRLNDDCLQLIFDMLPIKQRLITSQVCKRWYRLNQLYWENLQILDFITPPLTKLQLSYGRLEVLLKLCPRLKVLKLKQDYNNSGSNLVVCIAKYCKELKELALRGVSIKNRCLAFLARSCPNLTSFTLECCSSLHDHEMIFLLKTCNKLESLRVKHDMNTLGIWLQYLKPPLETLSLELSNFKHDFLHEGINRVKDSLKSLSLMSCTSLRPCDLKSITSKLTNLESLSLTGPFTLMQLNSLLSITSLKFLVSLDLSYNMIMNSTFLVTLAEKCPKLQRLILSGIDKNSFNSGELDAIVKFQELTHVGLAYIYKVTDDLLILISQKLKHLKIIDLMGCSLITDTGCVEIIANCHELERIDFSLCRNVTDITIITAIEVLTMSKRKKLHIIAADSGVEGEDWFLNTQINKLLTVDLSSLDLLSLRNPFFLDDLFGLGENLAAIIDMEEDCVTYSDEFSDIDMFDDDSLSFEL